MSWPSEGAVRSSAAAETGGTYSGYRVASSLSPGLETPHSTWYRMATTTKASFSIDVVSRTPSQATRVSLAALS